MTLEERLNDQLTDAERKIARLEEKIEMMEYADEWKWRKIVKIEENDLPVPRLEIKYREESSAIAVADYGIVIRSIHNCIFFIPFSSTRVENYYAKAMILPMRDGVNIKHDSKQLNLPAYITCGKEFSKKIEGDTQ